MVTTENRTQISTYSTPNVSTVVVLGLAAITASASPVVSLDHFASVTPPTMLDLFEYQMNRKFVVLQEKINQFGLLKRDWNGYDAAPIPSTALDDAKLFLQSLRSSNIDLNGWEVFPTARETIQFEKTVGENYIEIEVYSNGRFAYYSEGRENLEIESISIKEAMEKISGVFG